MDGLPHASDLPLLKRLNMTEEELLSVHRQNLIAFKGAVQEVYFDEKNSSDPINFLAAMQNIMEYTQFALNRLDVLMYELNLTNLPTPSEPVLFEPEPNEAVRNIRDLYVLQEMYLYLPIPLVDFPRLQKSHEATPAPPTTNPPPSPDVYMEYELLIEETSALFKYAGKVLEDYQMDRNGGAICQNVDLPGMPNRAELSLPNRIHMTEEQLLKTHHSNIYIYKEAMGHVIVDEQLSTSPKDFTVDFETIQLMKQRVLNREESVMTLLDITLDLLPTSQVVLQPEENEAIRNQRDCYILQEMTLYLPMCLQDFPRLQNKHSEAEPVKR
ncbi:uncharacterized protein [Amphiura filiformis]|uniref:uncharacterized protein n=1 Tax=Amphiura filiformis TaxID=82378 RepID=UPI003B21D6D1